MFHVWQLGRASHRAHRNDSQATPSPSLSRYLVADDRDFVESAEMGFMVCVERTSGMTKAGEEITVDIRSTTIFRKESGHWRVVHHHNDRF